MRELMELREKRVQTWNAAKAFLDSHRGNDGTLSAEDDAIYNKMIDDIDRLGKEVMRLEKLEALDVEMPVEKGRPETYPEAVFIPTDGGSKRHSVPECSGMYDPRKVSIRNAAALGFEPCKRCEAGREDSLH